MENKDNKTKIMYTKNNNCFYCNNSFIYSDNNETHISFSLVRPAVDSDGKIIKIAEEQALIVMTFEYAKILRDSLDLNIKKHEEKSKKQEV